MTQPAQMRISISPTHQSAGSNKSTPTTTCLTGSSTVAAAITPAHLLQLLPGAIQPESMAYFYGKTTREQAEDVLLGRGATEGLYLLRESVNRNYVISICHMGRVHHYNVERLPDGSYRIQTGHRFLGPVELVQHHAKQLDGFLTLARLPLNRLEGRTPIVLQGLHADELEQNLRLKAAEMGLKRQSVDEALSGPMRDHLRYLVVRELHTSQPWYHHNIRRREAERRLIEDGCREGAFLLRFRKEDGTFVLSLWNAGEPKHYKIEEHLDRWSIEGGQYFETLMEMIDHYHHRQDGLLCKLRHAVIAPSFTRSRSGTSATSKTQDNPTTTQVEDSAVQTSICTNGVCGWNGSQSLPSLCAADPVVSTSTCGGSTQAAVHSSMVNSNGEPSPQQQQQPTRQDLISFADWPNVTRLLSLASWNQPHQPITGSQSVRLTTSSSVWPISTTAMATNNPFPLTPFTPNMTPTPQNIHTRSHSLCPTTSPFIHPLSGTAAVAATATTTALAATTTGGARGGGGVNRNGNTQSTPQPNGDSVGKHMRSACGSVSLDRNPLHLRRIRVPSTSCLQPHRIGDPPVGRVTAEVDAAIRCAMSNAFGPPPSPPTLFATSHAKGDFHFPSTESHTTATTTMTSVSHGSTIPAFGSDRSLAETWASSGTTTTASSNQSTADLPPHTLHFPPILDTPWEEPDCSEDPSLSSQNGSSTNPAAAALFLSTNPFLSCVSPNAKRKTGGPNSSIRANGTNGTTIPSSSSSSLTNKATSSTPVTTTSTTTPTCTTTLPLSHSPDVSTFCSGRCCQPGHKSDAAAAAAAWARSSRSAWAEAVCQDQAQLIYDELPPSDFLLSSECVQLRERLGGGNFGHVVRGIFRTPSGQEVPVAVKTLKPSQIVNAGEREILAEARTMTQLKHRHIVRLIGVCKDEQFMLVLELAPLGPISKYLKKRLDVSIHTLTELMHQVAMGMAYLESCKFVHRDLAARNVLLVTRHFAKISDFGMSKALNFGSDYYRAATAGKWPLKWYAPECIYYFRFDSKSDVWSFGITLWEVYSYGERPYRDMKGAQILAMLDQGLRLPKPSRCPDSIYAVMQQCWNFDAVRRPTFAELVLMLSRLLKQMPTSALGGQRSGELTTRESPSTSGRHPTSPSTGHRSRAPCGSGGSGGSGVNSGISDGASF